MSASRRLDEIERRLGGDDALPTFRIVAPSPGLTAEAHDRWSAEQKREDDTRGEYSFTLNLGATDVR